MKVKKIGVDEMGLVAGRGEVEYSEDVTKEGDRSRSYGRLDSEEGPRQTRVPDREPTDSVNPLTLGKTKVRRK